jgi:hypothetical protein
MMRQRQQQIRMRCVAELCPVVREVRARWGRGGAEGEDIHRRCCRVGNDGNCARAVAADLTRYP